MNELIPIDPCNLSDLRPSHTLAAIDDSAITCAYLEELQFEITQPGYPIILAMLANQVTQGSRGHAKAKIITSITPEIVGFSALTKFQMKQELESAWKSIVIPNQIFFEQRDMIALPNRVTPTMNFQTTNTPQDYYWMSQAKHQITESNCRLDPAGCVFVFDDELLIQSRSTRFNRCECPRIPFQYHELQLNPGERMMFSDAQHAERQGVSQASLQHISLENSTLYVNKFPCRPCILSVLGAGIREVVFEKDSYGIPEAQLLLDNNVTIKRLLPRVPPE